LEKNYTGRQVQAAHTEMAKRRKEWPRFDLPDFKGDIPVSDVWDESPGEKRDTMIRKWCASVWKA